ncbi:MAG: 50S ribosomal protein L18 [Bacteroidetes bacterium]|nr:50S ribosomal protein L18 [Bacteroidota bacterium]
MARTALKLVRRERIRRSIRNKISGTSTKPRLAVYRSNKEIYAQLIDDINGVTLAAASSLGMSKDGKTPSEISKEVGTLIGEKAKGIGVETVLFDRGGNLYHGRVQALADGARESGLVF